MAGTIPKVIDDSLLHCQLCLKPLSRPKLLPCLHTFCEICLVKYMENNSQEKHTTEDIDMKIIESALKGGLDCEIPIHGYEDVVGDYPSLPRNRTSGTEKTNPEQKENLFETRISLSNTDSEDENKSKSKNEYSEIPSNSSVEDENKSKSKNEYSEIPSNSSVDQQNLPITKTNVAQHPMISKKQSNCSKTHQATTSFKKIKSKLQTIQNKTTKSKDDELHKTANNESRSTPAVNKPMATTDIDTGVYTLEKPTQSQPYIQMNKMTDHVTGHQDNSEEHTTPKNGSSSVSLVNSSGLKEKSAEITTVVDSYTTMDRTDAAETPSTNSPGIMYEVMHTSTEAQDNNSFVTSKTPPLTGFGLTSPISMTLYEKQQQKNSHTESEYSLEKPVKKSKKASNTSRFKLSKTISKSIDVSSPPATPDSNMSKTSGQNTVKTAEEKQSTTTNITDTSIESQTTSQYPMEHSTSNSYIGQQRGHDASTDNSNTTFLHSDLGGHDGYETPINKRPAMEQSCFDNRLTDEKSVSSNEFKNSTPVLPPRQQGAVGKLSPGTVNHTVDTLGSTQIQTRNHSQHSVFDHVYEEIEQNKNSSELSTEKSKNKSNVPMFAAISSTPKSLPMQENPTRMKSRDNRRTKKVERLLSKSMKSSESSMKSPHESPERSAGVQLGKKIARKSKALVDENGFAYISDKFEKVNIHHNDEDIELIYTEVCDVQDNAALTSPDFGFERLHGEILNAKVHKCPTCNARFKLPGHDPIVALPSIAFLENLNDTRRLKNNSQTTCKQCKATGEFKCLDCDIYLCKKCNDSHSWYKVVHNHQVMTRTQLQSGMFINKIMSSHKQAVCPNHSNEIPQYYCDTCSVAMCKECSHCYHNGHRCQLISDIAKRGFSYLENFENMTGHITHKFEAENFQIDKHKVQCDNDKEKILSDIKKQYATVQAVLDDAYHELVRQVDIRYNEEAKYLQQVQKCNEQSLQQIEQANKLADHVTEYGNEWDIVMVSKAAAENLFEMEKKAPMRIEHRMEVNYTPLLSVRPIDILPILGQAARQYKPIRHDPPESANKSLSSHSKDTQNHLHSFTPKTISDTKGCKPTGIALTKEDNIVLVDDINKKIKIFKEDGCLVREIVPQTRHELVDPWDVTVTNYGNFAVTDRGSKQVKIFDPDGDLVCHFGPHLVNPWGICCNKDGDLLVTDTEHKCVFVHDSNGNLKYRIDPPTKMAKFPEYVTSNAYNDIIVSDLKAHCIYVFNLLGQFLFKIGPREQFNIEVQLLHSPCGIYCDKNDNILVADYEMMRVSKFDKNGRFLSHFLTSTDNLRAPQSLIVNKKGHVILSDGNFIKTFSSEGMDTSGEGTEIDLELKPKVYNIRNNRQQRNQQCKKYTSDGEESNNLDKSKPVRKVGPVKPQKHQLANKKPVKGHQNRGSLNKDSSLRSASVPPDNLRSRNSQAVTKSFLKHDSSRTSVEKIKEKLGSLEQDKTPLSDRTGRQQPSSPSLTKYEKPKASVGQVKEQLINQTKQSGAKPKLRPKPGLKKLQESRKIKSTDSKATVFEKKLPSHSENHGDVSALKSPTKGRKTQSESALKGSTNKDRSPSSSTVPN